MAYAMLGPIGEQPVGKITVHAMSESDGQWQSFSAWIPGELLEGLRITRGITVSILLEGIPLPGGKYEWFCDYFYMLG
jgi:hypothetical protein